MWKCSRTRFWYKLREGAQFNVDYAHAINVVTDCELGMQLHFMSHCAWLLRLFIPTLVSTHAKKIRTVRTESPYLTMAHFCLTKYHVWKPQHECLARCMRFMFARVYSSWNPFKFWQLCSICWTIRMHYIIHCTTRNRTRGHK